MTVSPMARQLAEQAGLQAVDKLPREELERRLLAIFQAR